MNEHDTEPHTNSREDLGYDKPASARRRNRALPVVPSGTRSFSSAELADVGDEQIIRILPYDKITERPDNARRVFRGIEELGADIAQHGLLQAVLVRPKGDGYELVFGARRLRASKLAGLPGMPCIVRELTDAQAYEIHLVENINREDIHPLEEAESYRVLHETFGYSVEEISAKVGKGATSIRQRMKLCSLSKGAAKAFREEKFSAAIAFLVARIPHHADQDKAVESILEDNYDDEPMPLRRAQALVQDEYMLRLKDAPFDRADEALVPKAGACLTCPKRSGAQRDLFADIEAKDDMCTDARCYQQKQNAFWERRSSEAKEKGEKIVSKTEAKKIFGYGFGSEGRSLAHNAPYVDLKSICHDDPKRRTYGQLLAKADVEVPKVLARDEAGVVHELLDKTVVKKLLPKVVEKMPARDAAAMKRATSQLSRQREKERTERDAERAELANLVTRAQANEPVDGPPKAGQVSAEAFWRAFGRALTRLILSDSAKEVCHRRALETADGKGAFDKHRTALAKALDTMTAADARGLCVELVATCSRLGGTAEEKSRAELHAVYGGPDGVKGGKPKAKKAAPEIDWSTLKGKKPAKKKGRGR